MNLTVEHRSCSGATNDQIMDEMRVDVLQTSGTPILNLTTTLYRAANSGTQLKVWIAPYSVTPGE